MANIKVQKKQAIVKELVTKLTDSHFYITDSQGLSVSQINQIRKECFQKNIQYQVVKNTLLKRTLTLLQDKQLELGDIQNQSYFKGFSGVFIVKKAANEPAKIIANFQKNKNVKKPLLKMAIVHGELYRGGQSLQTLIKLKSKEVLISELISLLKSPTRQIVSSLQGASNKIAAIVKALPG